MWCLLFGMKSDWWWNAFVENEVARAVFLRSTSVYCGSVATQVLMVRSRVRDLTMVQGPHCEETLQKVSNISQQLWIRFRDLVLFVLMSQRCGRRPAALLHVHAQVEWNMSKCLHVTNLETTSCLMEVGLAGFSHMYSEPFTAKLMSPSDRQL